MRRTTSLGLLLTVPGAAQAAGYFSTGVGARCMGRGAACAVGASDLSAQYYNPAALVQVPSMVHLQGAGVMQAVHFDRADELQNDGSTMVFDPVENQAPVMPIPGFGVSSHFGHPDFALAFGVYTPYAPLLSFPADGPQRFSLVESTVLSGNVGPSAAYRVLPWLTVGAGVAWTFLQVEQSLVAHMEPRGFLATDDPDYDITTTVSARDPFALTWNLGLLFGGVDTPFQGGLAFVPPVHFDARGSLTSDFSKNTYYTGGTKMGQLIAVASATDDDVLLDVHMPMIVRAGGLWRPSDRAEVELDVAWQHWSGLGQLTLSEVDLLIDLVDNDQDVTVDDDIVLPSTLRDAVSVRLGGELAFRPRLAGRAGLFFETSAVSASYRSVMMPDGPKLGYGLGAPWRCCPSAWRSMSA
ncbi:MAG: outer membrane protein transport protein [Pseudomonadota bacterium]